MLIITVLIIIMNIIKLKVEINFEVFSVEMRT
nr:MAG TPA: hypothetical protein [Bacteriophage sp.]